MNWHFEPRWHDSDLTPLGSPPLRAWQPGLLRRIRFFSLLLLLGFLPAGTFDGGMATAGQSSTEPELASHDSDSTFKIQIERNMVLVRVIVRDRKGNPVPGLQKDSFQLFDNGKAQRIDQFAVESAASAPANASQATAQEEELEDDGAPAAKPANLIPRNYQALYFDDIQMPFEDVGRARDAAERYLETTLTPADRVGIFTTSGQGNLDFTADRDKLHEALFKLRNRPGMVSDTHGCPDIGAYQAYLIVDRNDQNALSIATAEAFACDCQNTTNQQICMTEAQSRAQGDATRVWNLWQTQSTEALRGLEQVIRRTALLPGQHSVVFISPGFLLYNLEPQLDQIEDRALRSNVVISTLDPRGLYVIMPGGDASQRGMTFTTTALMGSKQMIVQEGYAHAEDVLNSLALDTGGQFFHNSNDLDNGFRQMGMSTGVHYLLAFSPQNLRHDGKFHRLKVSLVNPGGFTVQARRGYFAPKASVDAEAKAKEEIHDAIFSQDELKELPVDVHTQFFKVNDTDARLTVLTHLDLSNVRFRKAQDRNMNNFTLVTALFDQDGKYVVSKGKTVEFRLRDATLAKLVQTGITMKTEFDVKPGTYLVRQIVRDSEAGQLSGLNRTVEIPY